ncbi:MAG: TraX family protein [Ruminiclostridium sp.]
MALRDMPHILKKGLNSYQLKILAVIFMTLDHVAIYLSVIPAVNTASEIMRIIGRIAAPLFLYVLSQGIRHTRSKEKFALRLYIASLAMGTMNAVIALAAPSEYLQTAPGNIFTTFFYVAFYVTLIERIIQAVQEKKVSKTIPPLLAIILTFGFAYIEMLVYNLTGFSDTAKFIIVKITCVLFPNTFSVEYSFLFIVLDVSWYFLRDKKLQCSLFALLCAASGLLMGHIPVFFHFRFFELFVPDQYWMFLSLPLIWLYNGNKGKSMKYFFYIYYPLHIYLLYLIGRMLT